jgi:hypothetical protein
MVRRSNKSIAEILTPSISAPVVDIAAMTHGSSPFWSSRSNSNDSTEDLVLERKITLAT